MKKIYLLIIILILIILIILLFEYKRSDLIEKYKQKNWTFIDSGGDSGIEYHYKDCVRLYNKTSKFQQIQVYKHSIIGNILVIDKDIQLTQHDEQNYHEMMVHVPLNYLPNAENILIIGGGDGGTLTQVLKHKNLKNIINIDIDQMVINVSKKYFPKIGKAFNNKRVNVIIGDGAKFVKQYANDPKYNKYFDVIIRDSTDFGQSESLFKKDFYEDCNTIMKEYSIFIFNYNSLGWERNGDHYIQSSANLKTHLGKHFKYTNIYQLYQPTFHSGHYSHAFMSNKIDPLNIPIDWYAFYNKKINTKYYNKDIHIGSFALPTRLQDRSITKSMERLGVHLIIDIIDADYEYLNNISTINLFIDTCLKIYKLQEIKRIHHKFTPYGITMISLLSTSHISIHTWPEKGTACVDIFTCSDFNFQNNSKYDIKKIIHHFFKTNTINIKTIDREF